MSFLIANSAIDGLRHNDAGAAISPAASPLLASMTHAKICATNPSHVLWQFFQVISEQNLQRSKPLTSLR
jgi:hypothetical protein